MRGVFLGALHITYHDRRQPRRPGGVRTCWLLSRLRQGHCSASSQFGKSAGRAAPSCKHEGRGKKSVSFRRSKAFGALPNTPADEADEAGWEGAEERNFGGRSDITLFSAAHAAVAALNGSFHLDLFHQLSSSSSSSSICLAASSEFFQQIQLLLSTLKGIRMSVR